MSVRPSGGVGATTTPVEVQAGAGAMVVGPTQDEREQASPPSTRPMTDFKGHELFKGQITALVKAADFRSHPATEGFWDWFLVHRLRADAQEHGEIRVPPIPALRNGVALCGGEVLKVASELNLPVPVHFVYGIDDDAAAQTKLVVTYLRNQPDRSEAALYRLARTYYEDELERARKRMANGGKRPRKSATRTAKSSGAAQSAAEVSEGGLNK